LSPDSSDRAALHLRRLARVQVTSRNCGPIRKKCWRPGTSGVFEAMSFAFDLLSRDDVKQHARAILDRLRAGTMPCEGAWPDQQVDLFQRWVDEGTQP
jgi:hypothetical protein